MNTILMSDPHILIEIPNDCRIIGSWLLRAAESQSFWSETLCNPAFKNQAAALSWWCEPSLEYAALEAVSAVMLADSPFRSDKTRHR